MEEYTLEDLENQYEKIVGNKLHKDTNLVLKGIPEKDYIRYIKNAIYRKQDIFTANPEILGEGDVENLY